MNEGFTDRTPPRRGTRRQTVSERPHNRGALRLQPTRHQDDAAGDGAAGRGRGQARRRQGSQSLSEVAVTYLPLAFFPALILMFGFVAEGMVLGALLSGFVAGFCLVVGE